MKSFDRRDDLKKFHSSHKLLTKIFMSIERCLVVALRGK